MNLKLKNILSLCLLLPGLAMAAGKAATQDPLVRELDGLGDHSELLGQAASINPNYSVVAVQGREVRRTSRHEISMNYENVAGGDPYLQTSYMGALYDYHINPHWSVGFQYSEASNKMSSEGDNLIDEMGFIPDMDFPKSNILAMGKFYPIYGKINFFDLRVVQFDFYALAGAGSITLNSGSKSTYTYGAGVGMWAHKNISVHLQWRRQSYTSERNTGDQDLNIDLASLSLGVLL